MCARGEDLVDLLFFHPGRLAVAPLLPVSHYHNTYFFSVHCTSLYCIYILIYYICINFFFHFSHRFSIHAHAFSAIIIIITTTLWKKGISFINSMSFLPFLPFVTVRCHDLSYLEKSSEHNDCIRRRRPNNSYRSYYYILLCWKSSVCISNNVYTHTFAVVCTRVLLLYPERSCACVRMI